MKTCSKCSQFKPLTSFYKHPSISNGIRAVCNDCRNVYRKSLTEISLKRVKTTKKIWEKTNRVRINQKAREYRKRNKERFKEYSLQKDFGISLKTYRIMEAEQGNVCAICKQPEKSRHQNGTTKALAVDHNNKTGKVRGLLCYPCNTGIGKLKEDLTIFINAIEYLKKTE